MTRRRILPLLVPLILALSASPSVAATSLVVDHVNIPQVDYEPALYYDDGDPLPHLDFGRIDWTRIVDKRHRRVVLESDYVRVEVLPEMGRVYSLIDKRTGHDALWKNDIVRPGGANNPTGWWLWIGGIEYTLPGYEHGTTFAMPWMWKVLEDSPDRVSMSMATTEPLTGLTQRVSLTVHRGSAALETQIRLHNLGADTVHFAHWVNPMWVPGGENELTDNTEFIIPTANILIADRWQKNLGPSPQGMSAASQIGAIRGSLDDGSLDIALSPALEVPNVVIEVSVDGKVTVRDTTSLTPAKVLHRSYPIETAAPPTDLSVEVRQGALQLLWFPITGENRRLE